MLAEEMRRRLVEVGVTDAWVSEQQNHDGDRRHAAAFGVIDGQLYLFDAAALATQPIPVNGIAGEYPAFPIVRGSFSTIHVTPVANGSFETRIVSPHTPRGSDYAIQFTPEIRTTFDGSDLDLHTSLIGRNFVLKTLDENGALWITSYNLRNKNVVIKIIGMDGKPHEYRIRKKRGKVFDDALEVVAERVGMESVDNLMAYFSKAAQICLDAKERLN